MIGRIRKLPPKVAHTLRRHFSDAPSSSAIKEKVAEAAAQNIAQAPTRRRFPWGKTAFALSAAVAGGLTYLEIRTARDSLFLHDLEMRYPEVAQIVENFRPLFSSTIIPGLVDLHLIPPQSALAPPVITPDILPVPATIIPPNDVGTVSEDEFIAAHQGTTAPAPSTVPEVPEVIDIPVHKDTRPADSESLAADAAEIKEVVEGVLETAVEVLNDAALQASTNTNAIASDEQPAQDVSGTSLPLDMDPSAVFKAVEAVEPVPQVPVEVAIPLSSPTTTSTKPSTTTTTTAGARNAATPFISTDELRKQANPEPLVSEPISAPAVSVSASSLSSSSSSAAASNSDTASTADTASIAPVVFGSDDSTFARFTASDFEELVSLWEEVHKTRSEMFDESETAKQDRQLIIDMALENITLEQAKDRLRHLLVDLDTRTHTEAMKLRRALKEQELIDALKLHEKLDAERAKIQHQMDELSKKKDQEWEEETQKQLEAQLAEFQAHLTKSVKRVEEKYLALNAKALAEQENSINEEWITKVEQERLDRQTVIENLKAKVQTLDAAFAQHRGYDAVSHRVHRVALALLDLEESIQRYTPVEQQFNQLRQAAQGDETIETVLNGLSRNMNDIVKSGIPTLKQLQNYFDHLHNEAHALALVKPGAGLMGHAFAALASSAMFKERRLMDESEPLAHTPLAAIAAAAYFIDKGDLQSAVKRLDSLEGPAAEVLADWKEQARLKLELEQSLVFIHKYVYTLVAALS